MVTWQLNTKHKLKPSVGYAATMVSERAISDNDRRIWLEAGSVALRGNRSEEWKLLLSSCGWWRDKESSLCLFVCLLRHGDIIWISILSLNWWAENSASFTGDGPVQYPGENWEKLVSDGELTSEEWGAHEAMVTVSPELESSEAQEPRSPWLCDLSSGWTRWSVWKPTKQGSGLSMLRVALGT